MEIKRIRNIAIVAHVDAGKTSVTEHFVFKSGTIREKGSVDKGTSQTDFNSIERERGISVFSSLISFKWKEYLINLIDTPGHADFVGEVERSLRAVEGAILIISAADGIQAQTVNYWNALRKLNIPTIIFVNKIDRVGIDYEFVLNELKNDLSNTVVPIQELPDILNSDLNISSSLNNKNINLLESLANNNNDFLEKYLNDTLISVNEITSLCKQQCSDSEIFPVLFGSAKNNIGIDELMDSIIELLPGPKSSGENDLSGIVFKISHDNLLGRVAHVRLFNGKISTRDNVFNRTQNIEEKVNQIKFIEGKVISDLKEISSGEIAAISGFSQANVGDILGLSDNIPDYVQINQPLLNVQVKASDENDYAKLADALQILSLEDPLLAFKWLKDEHELIIKIMGWIQIEILKFILNDRFNIKAEFEDPTVIYKETPASCGEGYERYWMPKPCWAIIKFLIEPGELGSGVKYKSRLSVDKVQKKYQNEIERTIPKALEQGVKGWEVTDIKITLIEGEDHQVHSNPGDFIIATPMAIMNGLQNIDTILLEPILKFKISAPESMLGKIAGDIHQMRGNFESPKIFGDTFKMNGLLPLATSIDYTIKLSSRSGGKARIITEFYGYQKVENKYGKVREYKGISPLDRSKYILKARKAIQ
ncbi:MAG: TetM/TetW/TetO/TetS family tetracycline resistance ribosomal protection protein [Bacteroidales bacterium]|nr:TetM/TetW/TetO/TetS family tetracycline resistance ribosomal protection protein [Bacteroidales bacterium]